MLRLTCANHDKIITVGVGTHIQLSWNRCQLHNPVIPITVYTMCGSSLAAWETQMLHSVDPAALQRSLKSHISAKLLITLSITRYLSNIPVMRTHIPLPQLNLSDVGN